MLCLFALLFFATGLAADTVILKTGKCLEGRIVSENADSLVIKVKNIQNHHQLVFEELTLAREDVASLRYGNFGSEVNDLTLLHDPDYNSIMFCPTPATIPKGDFYFRDFELYFLNFGWGAGESTSLSFMTHFPIVSVMSFGSIGIKHSLLDRETAPLGLALAGSYTFFTGDLTKSLLTGSLILGLGDKDRSLNLLVNQSYQKDGDPFTTFVLGGDIRIGRRTKFLAEYMNSTNFLFGEDDFNGFLNLGVRFFGKDWSFSFTGVRPMESMDSFMFLPMFQFSIHR